MMMDSRSIKDALALAAAKFQQAEGWLNALDGAVGDGDHGITMRIGFDAVRTLSARWMTMPLQTRFCEPREWPSSGLRGALSG